MRKWSTEINIQAPIEEVWELLNGTLEDMQKIMPQVIENTPIKETDDIVGSIYRQKYKEGKRIQEYEVETLEYHDTPDNKRLKVGFSLANMFEITALYELKKLDEDNLLFTYTATNRALKWFVKLFLIFASDKIVVQFAERVKRVAESQV
ncbi:SRPBCC family protein [Metabacillus herbersteinensis]|uniref:SRPBCC family protein n=1 Tax=Metabacillus herbersteinensis TaxID=283816 RepID=A0ABV6GC98_9BACI